MIRFETVPQDVYHHTPEVLDAVEALNRVGYAGILGSSREYRTDELSVPLVVTNPVSRSSEEPLGEFEDGFVVRTYGAANGQRFKNAQVFNALVAEVTGMPVIGVPLPDRDWNGVVIPDTTHGWRWHTYTDTHKRDLAVKQLDAYSDHVLTSVEKMALDEKADGRLYASGESAGAAVSLSIAHVARRGFDRGNVSISALPNVEQRHLYRELFVRDFATSDEGMHAQIHDGPVELAPLSHAGGFTENPKTRSQELVGSLGYLMRDMFGLWPIDPKFELYRTNVSLARTLTVATGLHMIERLVDKHSERQVVTGFFEHDKVARYEKLVKLGSDRCSPVHASFRLFENTSHTACNNPYIIGYMATQLLHPSAPEPAPTDTDESLL